MPVNENDFDKIQEIIDYLTVEFPDGLVEHKFVASRSADILFLSLKDSETQISVSKDFLEKNSRYHIEAKLVNFQLAKLIKKKRPPHITLTNSGLKK